MAEAFKQELVKILEAQDVDHSYLMGVPIIIENQLSDKIEFWHRAPEGMVVLGAVSLCF